MPERIIEYQPPGREGYSVRLDWKTMGPNDFRPAWVVGMRLYRRLFEDQPGWRLAGCAEPNPNPTPTMDIDKAQVELHAWVKWDGCTEVRFEDELTHFCSWAGLAALWAALEAGRDEALTIMGSLEEYR